MREQLERGMALQRAAQGAEAAAIYRAILEQEPDNPDALHLLGLVLGEEDRHAQALELIHRALEMRPNAAPFHHNIAGLYRRLGRVDDAEASFRRAIELKPDYGEAYQGLAECVRLTQDDPLAARAHAVLDAPGLDDRSRAFLHFALGKFYDDTDRFDPAFGHYQQGNALAGRSFDIAKYARQVRDTIFEFGPRRLRSLGGAGDGTELPVFVVGMPRSGTTLVEQILASHSRVHGAGELPLMRRILESAQRRTRTRSYAECVVKLGSADVRALATAYLDALRATTERGAADRSAAPGTGKTSRVVDKHPLNFQFVGLILLMFPKARIIHTVRHPLDTCLSCFFQHFTRGQDYTFDLDTLGHFYNNYRRLMEYWEQLFPGRIFHLEYEAIISDQRHATANLLEYCGLDFEQACLEFHQTERVVRTASFAQVRQPLYGSSVGRYRRYASHLGPLAELLGVPLDGPALLSERPR